MHKERSVTYITVVLALVTCISSCQGAPKDDGGVPENHDEIVAQLVALSQQLVNLETAAEMDPRYPIVASEVCGTGQLKGQPWESLGAGPLQPPKTEYCYTSSSDGKGFCLWAVTDDGLTVAGTFDEHNSAQLSAIIEYGTTSPNPCVAKLHNIAPDKGKPATYYSHFSDPSSAAHALGANALTWFEHEGVGRFPMSSGNQCVGAGESLGGSPWDELHVTGNANNKMCYQSRDDGSAFAVSVSENETPQNRKPFKYCVIGRSIGGEAIRTAVFTQTLPERCDLSQADKLKQ